MEEKGRYDVKRLSYSLNVKLTDNYEPDWRYIIFDDVNDAELDKLETVCNLLNQQDKELSKLQASYQQVKEENQQLKQQVEELKGKRLEFYNDDVRQTQVINGVHFDTEQLLVFSEYVEHEKNISADKDKQINQLKQQLHDLPKKIVGEIQENFDWKQCCEIRKYYDQQYIWFNYVAFNDFLDTILKKYGGENESVCD